MADWRLGLPVLVHGRVSLREPILADAPVLFRELCAQDVCEYVAPPPTAVDGVERMIAKGLERRRDGQAFSFGIQPVDADELAGIIQFVSTRDHVSQGTIPAVWELGFALGARYWGSGLMGEAAAMALQFAFSQVGLEAVEAWVVVENRRANRTLEKLGGVPESRSNVKAPDGRVANFVVWTLRDGSAGTDRAQGSRSW